MKIKLSLIGSILLSNQVLATDYQSYSGADTIFKNSIYNASLNTYTFNTTSTSDTFKGVTLRDRSKPASQTYKFILNASNATLNFTKYNSDISRLGIHSDAIDESAKNNPYTFELNAKEVIFSDETMVYAGYEQVINADVKFQSNATLELRYGNLTGSNTYDSEGKFYGRMQINGNLDMNGAKVNYYSSENARFVVNGTSSVKNTSFSLLSLSDKMVLIYSSGGFSNADTFVSDGNSVSLNLSFSKSYTGSSGTESSTITYTPSYANSELFLEGNELYAKSVISQDFNYQGTSFLNVAYLQAQAKYDQAKAFYDFLYNEWLDTENPNAQSDMDNAKAELDRLAALNASTSFNSSQLSEEEQVFQGLYSVGNIESTFDYINEDGAIVKSVHKSLKALSGNHATSNATPTPNLAQSIATDMAISNRFAMHSNPYESIRVAKALSKLRFAQAGNIASDVSSLYEKLNYENNLWANVFGGTNNIGANAGSLYGFNLGYDKRVFDDSILGAYITYANSKIKDDYISQKGDNAQLGVYMRNFLNAHEIDLKAYAQLAWIDQERTALSNGVSKSDYLRKYFGFNAKYGYVFSLDESFFIKPNLGTNLYYANTAAYTESGGLNNQSTKGANSFAMSVEAGLELRKYFLDESYLYIEPKVEQFVLSKNDDFSYRFVGSSIRENFLIKADDKKKTYGSIILGGDVSLRKDFKLIFSAGIKELLGGKVNKQSETYISGNVGAKYMF